MDDNKQYYSIRNLARRFGRSERTIRDWTQAGCATAQGRVVLSAIKAGKKLMVADEALAVFELRLRRASTLRPDLDLD